ncbi:hypothetical protein EW146_g2236 [Bondarzewia mesenterica]|uniref:Uncharacterized protein n=1 Tax=Bondarzewia mesenterica TaxID=1095465 RepID=A0A4S4M1R6_9AGAM|nr:hypothetical protein EW146_g2236 [Bondarzewia mesenterica]
MARLLRHRRDLDFTHDSYTRLRANRSPREADLVRRLACLDRRTYEVLNDSGESATKTSSYASTNPTPFLVTHAITDTGSQDAFDDWMKVAFGKLNDVDGWVRTRTYKCIDNLKTGHGRPTRPRGTEGAKISRDPKVAQSSAFKLAIESPFVKVEEDRHWDLYRAYPGIAQGNIGASAA